MGLSELDPPVRDLGLVRDLLLGAFPTFGMPSPDGDPRRPA